jgi:hypothetical protein
MENRGTVLPLHNSGARMECVIRATPRPFYPREGDQIPIVQEAGCASRPVWPGPKNSLQSRFEARTAHPFASRYTI